MLFSSSVRLALHLVSGWLVVMHTYFIILYFPLSLPLSHYSYCFTVSLFDATSLRRTKLSLFAVLLMLPSAANKDEFDNGLLQKSSPLNGRRRASDNSVIVVRAANASSCRSTSRARPQARPPFPSGDEQSGDL